VQRIVVIVTALERETLQDLLRKSLAHSYPDLPLESSISKYGVHTTVWNEMNYRKDISRITKVVHIEHPRNM
jgi:hypothetical protein